MRGALVLVAALVVVSSLFVSGWALKQRFDAGTRTRISICQSENALRQILHDEHVKKLANAEAFLREHPNGIPGIPRSLVLRGIADEREIVDKTQPRVCA